MKTIDELLSEGVAGKRVFVRADLNVPLDGTAITDDGRIRAVLPTVKALAEAGARVVVASHLGRHKGAPDPAFSLAPAAARLGELLGADVAFATDTVGESASSTVAALADGQGIDVLGQLALEESAPVVAGDGDQGAAGEGGGYLHRPHLVAPRAGAPEPRGLYTD